MMRCTLQAYIDGRGMYFLKLKEEDQLLNGTGAAGDLNGLVTQATHYDTSLKRCQPRRYEDRYSPPRHVAG
jgi:hypothetical protein